MMTYIVGLYFDQVIITNDSYVLDWTCGPMGKNFKDGIFFIVGRI